MIAPYAAFICFIFTVYEADKYSIITYHLLNQQTEALELKISTQDSAINDIKENIELIGETTAKPSEGTFSYYEIVHLADYNFSLHRSFFGVSER